MAYQQRVNTRIDEDMGVLIESVELSAALPNSTDFCLIVLEFESCSSSRFTWKICDQV